jgi:hypothetical protein
LKKLKEQYLQVIGYYFENYKQQELKNVIKMVSQNIKNFSLLRKLNITLFILSLIKSKKIKNI